MYIYTVYIPWSLFERAIMWTYRQHGLSGVVWFENLARSWKAMILGRKAFNGHRRMA